MIPVPVSCEECLVAIVRAGCSIMLYNANSAAKDRKLTRILYFPPGGLSAMKLFLQISSQKSDHLNSSKQPQHSCTATACLPSSLRH